MILALVAIWAFIGYRVFFKNSSLLDSANSPILSLNTNFNIKAKDTFELQKLERDPFLDTRIKKKKQNKPVSFTNNYKVNTIAKPFPAIVYYGFVKGQKSNEALVLLKVNNKMKRLRIKEEFEGLKVLRMVSDTVWVRFEKSEKFFVKTTKRGG